MSSSNKVILFYGAGPNVGAKVLEKFAANGWKTAAVVRTVRDSNKDSADLVIPVDFTDAQAIENAHSQVEETLGTPACVVYNAYGYNSMIPDLNQSQPFSAPASAFAHDLAINTVGCYAAASRAVSGFSKLPDDANKVFIYTGNAFPTSVTPEVPGLGSGKAASAYLIESVANLLGKQASSFWYFTDERFATGMPTMSLLSGEAHAEAYWDLANRREQGPWNYTFVKGKGYVKFDDVVDHKFTRLHDLMKDLPK